MAKKDVRKQERPDKPARSDMSEGEGYRTHVVIKFLDFVNLPYEDGIEKYIRKLEIGLWDRLVEEYPGITTRRLYTSLEPEEIRGLVDRATELDQTYHPPNLLTYFVIDCPPEVDPEALAEALAAWRNVQTAYVESLPASPFSLNPSDDPRFPNQGYLKKAPGGIDAEYAWTVSGGAGKGIQFVDLEKGWMLNHEDLLAANITLISGLSQTDIDHGTAVLGITTAVDNQKGGIGIAPESSARVVSIWKTATQFNTADAILSAINGLKFGDVLLIELETTALEPIETESAVFDMIRLGTALGIVIVEPAGNGYWDLDINVKDLSGKQFLNRTSQDFKDSGSIMAGAATSTTPHTRLKLSNFGSRIDCYAWGENVDTCWTDSAGTKSTYTSIFAGTSSASAIIAGAALVVQGIAEAKLNRRFNSWQLRAILSDTNLGTPAELPPPAMVGDPGIGVMPDLKAILSNKKLDVAPEVYIRDFVGDKGDPHTGVINASPDIILRQNKVVDSQKSFGEGSGTENSNILGHEAKTGQDNFIYVRVRNRGGSAAKDVEATIYCSPVATLVTPFLWTLVGSVKIPNVPTADLLTVSAPIIWKSKDIPAPGHYCFVGLVGNQLDPAPIPPDFMDWNKFYRLIRENNNVTWRNFQVVGNAPKSPSEFVELPFLAAGGPEIAMRFQFRVVARLPEGASAWLEMPLYLVDVFGERSPYLRIDEERNLGRVPLNPHGGTNLGEAFLQARSVIELKLLVDLPEKSRRNEYEVFISQLYQGDEVGRVTWRLVPERGER